MSIAILRGDARSLPLPDESVDLVVTSPPYFGLRDYRDGDESLAGQIGSEATPRAYIAALVECAREWVRVLKPSGSLFVNLGDKYSGGMAQNDGRPRSASPEYWRRTDPKRTGIPNKSLMGLPWRYALACTDDLGLILRRDIIWSKPNGLPQSVTDRCRSSHEYVFHFTRLPRYYAAVDEIREPHTGNAHSSGNGTSRRWMASNGGANHRALDTDPSEYNPLGKLPGSVWDIPSQPLTVPASLGIDHFAAYPVDLPRRIIAGWSPPGICTECGEGRRPVRDVDWSRIPHVMTEKRALTTQEAAAWCSDFADWCDAAGISRADLDAAAGTSDMGGWWKSRLSHRAAVPTPEQWAKIRATFDPPASLDTLVHLVRSVPAGLLDAGASVHLTGRHRTTGGGLSSSMYLTITGHACACDHPTAPTRPAVVLDPFAGTGTTLLAADALGRHALGTDLSAGYCRLARWRTTDPGERAKAWQVPKPPPVLDGQGMLWNQESP
jgi:DNA modification methylase